MRRVAPEPGLVGAQRRNAAARTAASIVLLLLATACAQPPVDPDCPASAQQLPVQALYGSWEARFEGLPGRAAVRLGKHPDYDGVRGTITRGDGTQATVAQLAGDVDDQGLLTIDESQDGRSISGIWQGALQPGSCGRQFSGTWRNTIDDRTHSFQLTKTGSSQ